MYDVIVLIDSFFPFQCGEQFLENEIKYLSASAREVYIFPIFATNDSHNRLPKEFNNIHAEKCLCPRNIWHKCVTGLKVLLFGGVIRELRELCKKSKLSIKAVKYLISCYAVADSELKRIDFFLRNKIKESDRVLFYSYWMCEQAYIASNLAKKYGGKCISRCHGYDIYEYRAMGVHLPFRSMLFERLDKIYPISEDGVRYLKEIYGKAVQGKIERVYLGTPDCGLNPDKKVGSVFTIVSCSNLVPVKRVDLLILALSRIRKECIHWVHYGDGELREELYQLAKEQLPDNISWSFEGHVDNATLMKKYREEHYDLFVNVSSSEGLPVSIMEAMSFGIPVLATDVGGTSEIVEDGRNGYLVKSEITCEELKDKIKLFISLEDDMKTRMRFNARKTWEASFVAEKNYRAFYEDADKLAVL